MILSYIENVVKDLLKVADKVPSEESPDYDKGYIQGVKSVLSIAKTEKPDDKMLGASKRIADKLQKQFRMVDPDTLPRTDLEIRAHTLALVEVVAEMRKLGKE